MIIIIIMCITIQYVVLSHDEINDGVTMEAMLCCTREGTNDHFFHLSEQFKSIRQNIDTSTVQEQCTIIL